MNRNPIADIVLAGLIALQSAPFDPEANHAEADDLLCDLLKELGYVDIVEAYEKIEKWYA